MQAKVKRVGHLEPTAYMDGEPDAPRILELIAERK